MLNYISRFLSSSNIDRGAYGEKLAASYLTKHKGFKVIVRNWRNPADRREEIDIVCRDDELLVIVEVKTRAAGSLVRGADAIDRRKKSALRRAAFAYLRGLPSAARPKGLRFDIVEVTLDRQGTAQDIAHFENAELFGRGLW